MSVAPSAEKDEEWTGCVHCGQPLPHEGTSWREAYRCRLFQRIAEQAWDEGWGAGLNDGQSVFRYGESRNPHRVIASEEDDE